MDIKAKIEELANRIKNDSNLQKEFTKDPVKAVQNLLGVELPKEQIQAIVDGIKAKVNLDAIGNALGGLFGKKN